MSYHKYKSKMVELYSYEEGIDLTWVINYIIAFLIFVFTLYATQVGFTQGIYLFGIVLLIYIVYINYNAFKQEGILIPVKDSSYQKNPIEIETTSFNPIETSIIKNAVEDKDLEPDWIFDLAEKLEYSMKVEKKYLETNLNLFHLSDHLNSNTKYVSYTINNHFNKNFSRFVNEFRIEEAIDIISSKDSEQYTLEYIANKSGFKSRSSFTAAFKKIKNMTPSQFKRSLSNQYIGDA